MKLSYAACHEHIAKCPTNSLCSGDIIEVTLRPAHGLVRDDLYEPGLQEAMTEPSNAVPACGTPPPTGRSPYFH